jgi:hypothetical protein
MFGENVLEDEDDRSPDDEPPTGQRLEVTLDREDIGLEQILDLETTSETEVNAGHQYRSYWVDEREQETYNPIPAQLMSWAEPTNEIHQSRNLTAVDESDKYDKHPIIKTKRTETHGTPCLLTRPSILGAWPFCDIPNIAREAVKTKELVVENIETRIRALMSEGRNGISSRFIAAKSEWHDICEEKKRRTDDVGWFGGSWCSVGNGSEEIGVVRSRDDSDAKGSSEVEEDDSVNSRVKSRR